MTANKRFKRLVRERARRTGASYLAARSALLRTRSREDEVSATSSNDLVELAIEGVEVAAEGNYQPYVYLREKDGRRRLSIFIGAPEALAIRFALEGGASARPMTHDALQQALLALGGRVERIVIDLVAEASTYLRSGGLWWFAGVVNGSLSSMSLWKQLGLDAPQCRITMSL